MDSGGDFGGSGGHDPGHSHDHSSGGHDPGHSHDHSSDGHDPGHSHDHESGGHTSHHQEDENLVADKGSFDMQIGSYGMKNKRRKQFNKNPKSKDKENEHEGEPPRDEEHFRQMKRKRRGVLEKIRRFGSKENLVDPQPIVPTEEGHPEDASSPPHEKKKRKEAKVRKRKDKKKAVQSGSDEESCAEDEKFGEDVLKVTNQYRKHHHVHKLTLNKELNVLARKWTSMLAKGKGVGEHDRKYGCNIYTKRLLLSGSKVTADEVVDNWYSEIRRYNYVNPETPSSHSENFTQLVWRNTREIGVSRARSSNKDVVYVVAFFHPRGNVTGEFPRQVPPLGGFPVGSVSSSSSSNDSDIHVKYRNSTKAPPHSPEKQKKGFFGNMFRRFRKTSEKDSDEKKKKKRHKRKNRKSEKYSINDDFMTHNDDDDAKKPDKETSSSSSFDSESTTKDQPRKPPDYCEQDPFPKSESSFYSNLENAGNEHDRENLNALAMASQTSDIVRKHSHSSSSSEENVELSKSVLVKKTGGNIDGSFSSHNEEATVKAEYPSSSGGFFHFDKLNTSLNRKKSSSISSDEKERENVLVKTNITSKSSPKLKVVNKHDKDPGILVQVKDSRRSSSSSSSNREENFDVVTPITIHTESEMKSHMRFQKEDPLVTKKIKGFLSRKKSFSSSSDEEKTKKSPLPTAELGKIPGIFGEVKVSLAEKSSSSSSDEEKTKKSPLPTAELGKSPGIFGEVKVSLAEKSSSSSSDEEKTKKSPLPTAELGKSPGIFGEVKVSLAEKSSSSSSDEKNFATPSLTLERKQEDSILFEKTKVTLPKRESSSCSSDEEKSTKPSLNTTEKHDSPRFFEKVKMSLAESSSSSSDEEKKAKPSLVTTETHDSPRFLDKVQAPLGEGSSSSSDEERKAKPSLITREKHDNPRFFGKVKVSLAETSSSSSDEEKNLVIETRFSTETEKHSDSRIVEKVKTLVKHESSSDEGKISKPPLMMGKDRLQNIALVKRDDPEIIEKRKTSKNERSSSSSSENEPVSLVAGVTVGSRKTTSSSSSSSHEEIPIKSLSSVTTTKDEKVKHSSSSGTEDEITKSVVKECLKTKEGQQRHHRGVIEFIKTSLGNDSSSSMSDKEQNLKVDIKETSFQRKKISSTASDDKVDGARLPLFTRKQEDVKIESTRKGSSSSSDKDLNAEIISKMDFIRKPSSSSCDEEKIVTLKTKVNTEKESEHAVLKKIYPSVERKKSTSSSSDEEKIKKSSIGKVSKEERLAENHQTLSSNIKVLTVRHVTSSSSSSEEENVKENPPEKQISILQEDASVKQKIKNFLSGKKRSSSSSNEVKFISPSLELSKEKTPEKGGGDLDIRFSRSSSDEKKKRDLAATDSKLHVSVVKLESPEPFRKMKALVSRKSYSSSSDEGVKAKGKAEIFQTFAIEKSSSSSDEGKRLKISVKHEPSNSGKKKIHVTNKSSSSSSDEKLNAKQMTHAITIEKGSSSDLGNAATVISIASPGSHDGVKEKPKTSRSSSSSSSNENKISTIYVDAPSYPIEEISKAFPLQRNHEEIARGTPPLRGISETFFKIESIEIISHSSSSDSDHKSGTSKITVPKPVKEYNHLEISTSKFAWNMCNVINLYRMKHQALPLAVDRMLCRYAMQRAKSLVDAEGVIGGVANNFGENLYICTASKFSPEKSLRRIVRNWYRKKVHYVSGSTDSQLLFRAGPFTQLVWCDTKLMGAGYSTNHRDNKVYVVALFSPAGNIIGKFSSEVHSTWISSHDHTISKSSSSDDEKKRM